MNKKMYNWSILKLTFSKITSFTYSPF